MSKHTPGPWEVTEFTAENGQPFDSVGELIAHTALSARHGGTRLYGVTMQNDPQNPKRVVCYSGNGKASEANARLMAAGPTMLEALKQAEAVLGEAGSEEHIKQLTNEELGKLWLTTTANVRAAIKLAEGGE